MKESTTVPPIVNRAMKYVLRSPLHRVVSKSILLITFTGRKSGKIYTTPVSYSQSGNQVTIFTHANWWKNLDKSNPITLRIQGHDVQGLPETIKEDKASVAAGLVAHLKKVPSDARFYHVSFDKYGNPVNKEVAEAVQTVVMVKIYLC